MLGFFRKYEKTFFLLVFAPAVLSLGVTGVMVSVFQSYTADVPTYTILGEKVSQIDVMKDGTGSGDIDARLQAFAWDTLARQLGLQVPVAELQEEVRSFICNDMLDDLTRQRLADMGISQNDFQRFFQNYFKVREEIQKSFQLTPEVYNKFLEDRRLTGRDFEDIMTRRIKVKRLTQGARDLAYVTPAQLAEAYQDKYSRRAFEVISLDAKDHKPTLDNINEKEIEAYYEKNKDAYKIPMQFEAHVLRLPFEIVQKSIAKATDEDLRAFYDNNPGYYRDSAGQLKAFDSVKDSISKDWLAARTEEETLKVLEEARNKLSQTNQIADMAVIASTTECLYETSTKGDVDSVKKSLAKVDGKLIDYWLGRNVFYRPSTPLLGADAGFIIRFDQRVNAEMRKLEDVRDQVRKDYVEVSDFEAKQYFRGAQNKYREARKISAEVLELTEESALKKVKDPTEVELLAWFDAHKADFQSKPLAEVKDDATKAYKAEKAQVLIDEMSAAVQAFLKKYKDEADKKLTSLDVLTLETSEVPNSRAFSLKTVKVAEDAIGDDPTLGSISARVLTAETGKPIGPEARPGEAKGFMVVLVTDKGAARIPEFDEVAAKVKADILEERAYERCREAARELLQKLKGLTGTKLVAFLAEKKLSPKRSPMLKSSDETIEGYKTPKQYVSALFRAKVDGDYSEQINLDDDRRVDLLRCAAREDAPLDEFSRVRDEIRKDVLNKVSNGLVGRWQQEVEVRARSISNEHLKYALDLYNNGSNIMGITARQLALPPDREILGQWLEDKAREELKTIKAQLDKGTEFDRLITLYTEDELTRNLNGVLMVNRNDLTDSYGKDFSEAVFSWAAKINYAEGVFSEPMASKKGVHLIKMLKKFDDGRLRLAHLMLETSIARRKPPEDKLKEAKAATRKVLESILERLKKESFDSIMKEFESNADMAAYERGESLQLSDLGPFPIALSDLYQEELPPVFESKGAWHVVAAENADRRNAQDSNDRSIDVYHIAFDTTKRGADRARSLAEATRVKLIDYRSSKDSSGDQSERTWGDVMAHFKELATQNSDAPTAAKQGILGTYSYDKRLSPYGKAWLSEVMKLAHAPEGQRLSAIVETPYGLHIIEVTEVKTPKPADVDPFGTFRSSVIARSTWR